MVAHSIGIALQSGLFERVIVSTDDSEIASVAVQYGALTPFLRPDSLADDLTGLREVMVHAVCELSRGEACPPIVCCITATSPFLLAEDLRRGFELLSSSEAEFAYSVCPYAYPIQRAIRISSDGRVEMFHPEHRLSRSQDLEPAYHDAAQFYWGRREAWLDTRLWIPSRCSVPVIVDELRVVDIDTEKDWCRAEAMAETFQRL